MEFEYLKTKSKVRISDLEIAKIRGEKWPMLTSYDATSAKIFDLAGIPVILVGDSAAQAVYGYKSTIPITMKEMLPLAKAVASSCQRALVIGDMPFGSYQESPQVALKNATRFMKEAQVHGVKLEGCLPDHVRLLTTSGIPVMAHIGLTPQSEHALSGYKVQGRDELAKVKILESAKKLEAAGAFACVLELVPTDLGYHLQQNLRIPVIGIGAGPGTDAQVLVWTDMVGFSPPKGTSSTYLSTQSSDFTPDETEHSTNRSSEGPHLSLSRPPKFVKRYANFSQILYEAARSFAKDVSSNSYPAKEHCYD